MRELLGTSNNLLKDIVYGYENGGVLPLADVKNLIQQIDTSLAALGPGGADHKLAEAELRSTLHTEMVARCINAASDWHERVYLKDKGARQSLMAAVYEAGMCGLENIMLKENVFSSYLAFLVTKKQTPEPEATKMATAIIEAQHASNTYNDWVLNAAALIESRSKRVPRVMLDELCEYGLNCGFIPETSRKIDLDAIAAKYGYHAE